MPEWKSLISIIGEAVEGVGVLVIVSGLMITAIHYLRHRGQRDPDHLFLECRQGIGRSILLGLEILVAGDIIRTVAIDPNFYSVGVLAILVLIRTFLSWALEVELTGHWPWQSQAESRP